MYDPTSTRHQPARPVPAFLKCKPAESRHYRHVSDERTAYLEATMNAPSSAYGENVRQRRDLRRAVRRELAARRSWRA